MKSISELVFQEVNNEILEATNFYKYYSQLRFNGGVIFKKVAIQPKEGLEGDFTSLTIKEVSDFVFEFLTNETIKKMDWRYVDSNLFTHIEGIYASKEKFSKIGFLEIDLEDFQQRLNWIAQRGAVYQSFQISESKAKNLVSDFITHLKNEVNILRIFSCSQPWGDLYSIGEFECYFIISAKEILVFCKDDYD